MPRPRPSSRTTSGRGARVALAIATSVLLGACATREAAPPVPAGETATLVARRDAALAAFDRFSVRGGLGLWNDERSVSARVTWRQTGETLDIGLVAPLGLGSARLLREDGRAVLFRGNAPPLTGESADRVLQRALGLDAPLPLDQLAAWLRGLPGEASDVRRDEAGRLRSLRWTDEGGTRWQARVLDYARAPSGVETGAGEPVLELPSLVTARGAGYRMRLVLRDWSADPGTGSPGTSPGGTGDETAPDAAVGAGEPEPRRAPSRLPIPSR